MESTIQKHKIKLEIEYEGNYKLLPFEVKQLLEQNNRLIKNIKVEKIE
jgi:hypothetical protein